MQEVLEKTTAKADRAKRLRREMYKSLAGIVTAGLLFVALFVLFLNYQNERRISQDEFEKKERQEKLQKFITDKNCKIVGKRDGTGLFQRAQTGFMCDDGVTYWKND